MFQRLITYNILIVIFITFSNVIFAQPEIYLSSTPWNYNDINEYFKVLKQGRVSKINIKKGNIKEIYQFDTLDRTITLTEKLFNIKTSFDKFWFNDSRLIKSKHLSLRREKAEFYTDLLRIRNGDTLITYLTISGDTLLQKKSFFDKSSGARIYFMYITAGIKLANNEFYTITRFYDNNENIIRETLLDTTSHNNCYLTFDGKYDSHGNIIQEKCYTKLQEYPSYEVTVDYNYKFNRYGDWIKKSYYWMRTNDTIKIKRKIKYF